VESHVTKITSNSARFGESAETEYQQKEKEKLKKTHKLVLCNHHNIGTKLSGLLSLLWFVNAAETQN
jgi:hypothetical protein